MIKEDVEKGKELRVLLNTWILCYARDHGMIYVLDAYDSHHEATILIDFLQAKASKLGKPLGFGLEKRTDIDILSVNDERDAIYATVQIKSSRQIEEGHKKDNKSIPSRSD